MDCRSIPAAVYLPNPRLRHNCTPSNRLCAPANSHVSVCRRLAQ